MVNHTMLFSLLMAMSGMVPILAQSFDDLIRDIELSDHNQRVGEACGCHLFDENVVFDITDYGNGGAEVCHRLTCQQDLGADCDDGDGTLVYHYGACQAADIDNFTSYERSVAGISLEDQDLGIDDIQ